MMRPVCVICTETFVINSHITACPCGHVFHEECVFRWLRSGQHTCPQCRARVKESSVIKRLYLTESDNIMPTQCLLNNVATGCEGQDGAGAELAEKYQQLVYKLQELKAEVKEKDETLALKNRIIEQNEKNLKELNDSKTIYKKKVYENKLTIDYMKKKLENYNRLKTQINERDTTILELQTKLKQFETIEMIYKDHESQFATELKKYVTSNMSLPHCQAVIRHLVNANVLLKEQLDKQNPTARHLNYKRYFRSDTNETNKQLENVENYENGQLKSSDTTDSLIIIDESMVVSPVKKRKHSHKSEPKDDIIVELSKPPSGRSGHLSNATNSYASARATSSSSSLFDQSIIFLPSSKNQPR